MFCPKKRIYTPLTDLAFEFPTYSADENWCFKCAFRYVPNKMSASVSDKREKGNEYKHMQGTSVFY